MIKYEMMMEVVMIELCVRGDGSSSILILKLIPKNYQLTDLPTECVTFSISFSACLLHQSYHAFYCFFFHHTGSVRRCNTETFNALFFCF